MAVGGAVNDFMVGPSAAELQALFGEANNEINRVLNPAPMSAVGAPALAPLLVGVTGGPGGPIIIAGGPGPVALGAAGRAMVPAPAPGPAAPPKVS